MEAIERVIEWTGWKRTEVMRLFGISSSQMSRWRQEKPVRPSLINPFSILDEEVQRVIDYRKSSEEIRRLGYRKLTWKMIDEGIAFLTEPRLYTVF